MRFFIMATVLLVMTATSALAEPIQYSTPAYNVATHTDAVAALIDRERIAEAVKAQVEFSQRTPHIDPVSVPILGITTSARVDRKPVFEALARRLDGAYSQDELNGILTYERSDAAERWSATAEQETLIAIDESGYRDNVKMALHDAYVALARRVESR